MIDLALAQLKINDAFREAEEHRLLAIARRSGETYPWVPFEKLACRFGLIQTCKPRQFDFNIR